MNDRAAQDAQETLQALEAQARRKAWGDAAKARWAAHKADSAPCVPGPPTPPLTEQQKQEHQQYIEQNKCPF